MFISGIFWYLISIIYSKSISYPKITNVISINSIFSLVSKYIIFVMFWHCLILRFCRTHIIDQSQHFDFDFLLFSIKHENSILKNWYLIYLHHFYSLHLIFTSLKPLLNLSLTKLTLQLKSFLLSMDQPHTHTLLAFISYLYVFCFINFVWITFCEFNDRTKTHRQNGAVARDHALLIWLLDSVVIFMFLSSVVYWRAESLTLSMVKKV